MAKDKDKNKNRSKKYIPTKEGLERLYDAINLIARRCEARGIDTSEWFTTEEELKKDPNNIFI